MAEPSYVIPRIIDGLKVLQKYLRSTPADDEMYGFILTENRWGTHGQIIVRVDWENISQKDRKKLDVMGWGEIGLGTGLCIPKKGSMRKPNGG